MWGHGVAPPTNVIVVANCHTISGCLRDNFRRSEIPGNTRARVSFKQECITQVSGDDLEWVAFGEFNFKMDERS